VGADVGATLREMWHTRPSRRKADGKIAGVAGAIARRYAIDPTLVRVGFVVAAFYGVGVVLYIVGILLLPREHHPADRDSTARVVVASVLLVLYAGGPLFGGRPAGLIGLAVVGGLLYALHRSRAGLGHRDDPAAPPPSGGAEGSVGPDGQQQPPAWDPLGAAPFAWDLPEPGAAPPPRPPRSPLVPATLGLALLAGAIVLTLGLVGVLPVGVTPVVATMLAVVGAGLLVGAFLHRGRGLILAAVPLALVLVAAAGGTSGPPWRDGFEGPTGFDPPSSRGIGTGSWAPVAVGSVAPTYQTGMGDADLDLRGLAAGPPVSTTVRSGAGDVKVRVPENADVTAECESGAGNADCLGHGEGRVVDLGPDGPGGQVIDLHAMAGAGDVEVRRG
jgi:phage shock protein PspC (stress-responsive transcriptional regulator)